MSNKNILVNFSNKSQLDSDSQYLNLNFFKESMGESFHQVYAGKRRQATLYQSVFFILSFIFLSLALIVYFKTTNWKCDFYLGNCELIRVFTYSFCLLLSLGTVGLGFTIRPEKEAIHALVRKMENNLLHLYQTYQNQSSQSYSPSMISFHEVYHQTLDVIHERQEKTIQLLEAITLSKEIKWTAKERLFNLAIHELHDKLNHAIYTFRSKAI